MRLPLPRPTRNVRGILYALLCGGFLLLGWYCKQLSTYDRHQNSRQPIIRYPMRQESAFSHRVSKPIRYSNVSRFLDTDVIYTYLDRKGQHAGNVSVAANQHLISYHLKEMRVLMNNTAHQYPGKGLPKECARKDYGALYELPKASVVITFHNSEHLLNIVHTLHSIFENSPHEVIHEIIIIDDNSVKEELKDVLQNYVDAVFGRHVSNIRIVRSQSQLGLIRGRLLAARLAEGDVIVSMDSHMELRPGWLESLLYEIKLNRKTLASSCLDWMKPREDGSWVYEHGGSEFRGVFDWDLGFGYYGRYIPADHDPTEPLLTPIIVGTIFAIEKAFFFETGGFDDGMEAWGGENIDLSLRVFLCGGRVINVPCSHAAHLEQPGQRDYRTGWDSTIQRNYNRVVLTHFGPYVKYFHAFKPNAKDIDAGDILQRKKSLQQCPGNFSWFLDNFYPEMGNPERDVLAFGRIKNSATGQCIDRNLLADGKLYPCHNYGNPQVLLYTSQGYLRTGLILFHVQGTRDKTISETAATSLLDPTFHPTRWIHKKNGLIVLEKTQQCLEADHASRLRFSRCDPRNKQQSWSFDTYTDNYDDFVSGLPSSDEQETLGSASQRHDVNRRFRERFMSTLRKHHL